jgi:gliding motility-associated-like protein
LDIAATDLAGNSDTITFSITVLNTNDGTGTPIFTMTIDTLMAIEGYLNAAIILAQDPDSNDVFYFNIIGGVDSQFFDIDTVTGYLSFDNIPLFDMPLDNNGDNIYEIRLQVRDTSGVSSNQLFYISVLSCKSIYLIDSIFKNNITICDASNGLISIFSNADAPRPVEYSIDGGTNWQSQNLFFNQAAGSYPVFIKSNDNVCIIEGDIIIIDSLTSPVIDSVSTINTNCNDSTGQIQVHATGDFEYSINAGISWQADSTFLDLAGNNYFIAIRNTDSTCPNLPLTQNPVSIQIAPTPTIAQFSATDPTDCGLSDGIISISAINGNGSYLYSIDSGQTFLPNNIFNNLAGDSTYHLILANADTTCQIQGATISMVNKTMPVIDSVPSFSSISDCNLPTPNGSITVYASGNSGLQYSADSGATWQSSNVFINLNAGLYPIFIRNIDGSCEVDANININITTPQPPIINGISTINNTDCDSTNGTIMINATAQSTQPIEYSINGGANYQVSNVFSNLGANSNYNIIVRHIDGSCEVGYLNNPAVITQPSSPLIEDIDPMSPSDCGLSDGSIDLTASGGLAPLQYGISTANGIQWQSNGFFSNLSSNTYTVYIRSADSTCQVSSVPILIDTLHAVALFAPINFVSPTNCANNDGSITIFAMTGDSTDFLEYSIDNGVLWQSSPVFDSLWAGVYDIIVRSNGSCESTPFNNQLLPTDNQFIQNVEITPPTDCGQQDAQIRIIPTTGLGNLQYSIDSGVTWSTSSLFTNLYSGSFWVGVRAINGLFGCEEYDSVVIVTPTVGDAEILEIVDVSCFGARDGSAKIRFDYPTGSQIINVTGLQSGQQVIQSDSLLGCQDSVTIIINEPPLLEIRLLETPTSDGILGSINSIVSGGTSPYSYLWSNGETTDLRILNLEVGDYSITVTDDNGCTITDSTTIKEKNSQVFNTITPNGDGINDVLFFGKIANNVCTESELIVMNRWGQVVYESGKTVYNNDWNGVDNQGKPLPNGAYLYIFRCDVRLEKRSLMILR